MEVGIVWVEQVLSLQTGEYTLFHEGLNRWIKVFRKEGDGFRALVDFVNGTAKIVYYDEQGMFQKAEFLGKPKQRVPQALEHYKK